MKVLPLLCPLLLGLASAQVETRLPPEPLVMVGVGQDSTGNAVAALRGRYSTHIRLVDPVTGEQKRELWLPPEVLQSVKPVMSGDGKKLAVMLTPDPKTGLPRVALLNVESARLALVPPDSASPFATILTSGGLKGTINLVLNRDGTRLAAGNSNGYVQLWDTVQAKRLTTIQSDTKLEPSALQFSAAGDLFAPTFRTQTRTRIFNAATGELRLTLSGVGLGQFAPGGDGFLATRGRLISLTNGKELPQPAYLKDAAAVIGYSSDGSRILVRRSGMDAQGREWLELREVASGRVLGTVTRIPDGGPEYLTPDGTSLMGGDGQGGIRILPLAPR